MAQRDPCGTAVADADRHRPRGRRPDGRASSGEATLGAQALPPPNIDFYEVIEIPNPDDLALLKQVRAFMKAKVAPVITKYCAGDAFPFELPPEFRELGIGGLGMQPRAAA